MIRFDSVSYQYQDINEKQCLKDINLTIPKGQFLLITGKSGCGKSTLASCISGLIPYFHEGSMEGKVWIEKEQTSNLTIDQIGEKVGSVFQNPRTQFFTTSTIDEIAFGCQNMSLPREEILKRMKETLQVFKIEDLRERSLFELSSGQKQKVAIASCYSMKPQIYVMDEPSANLDPKAIDELTEILKVLKKQGHTIIIMEHRLYYLKDLIDQVIYMEEGKIVRSFSRQEALALPMKNLSQMGLRAFDLNQVEKSSEFIAKEKTSELSVEHLAFSYKTKKQRKGLLSGRRKEEPKKTVTVLKDINFKAYSGEIVGIIGKNGAGKTTLAKVLTGLNKAQKGSICINGKVLDENQRMKAMYFVLQDSDYQLFTESVEQELSLGYKTRERRIKADHWQKEVEAQKEKGKRIIQNLGLSEYMKTHPAALSRGQKQRLTIACGLLSDAPILILDEPTSGLDGASMREVIQLLKEVQKTGKIIFVISHDYEFLLEGCNRIIEIEDGIVNEAFELNKKTASRLENCLFGEKEQVKWSI